VKLLALSKIAFAAIATSAISSAFVLDAPKAVAASCSYAAFQGATCTLTVGDKKLDSISTFSRYAPNALDTISLNQLTSDTYQFQYSFSGGANTAGGSFDYAISITDPNKTAGWTFQNGLSNVTGGGLTPSYFTTVSSTALVSSATSRQSSTGSVVSFNSGVNTATFTQSWTVTSGSVSSLGFTLDQLSPGESVPGPLPLLGAGTAFGFSRKLRKRIKQVS